MELTVKGRVLGVMLAASLLAGCGSDTPVEAIPADSLDGQLASTVKGREFTPDTRSLPAIDSPMAQLGKALFFARSLSGDGDVACASCHHPLLAGGDGLSLPVGVQSRQPLLLGPGRRLFPNSRLDPVAGDGPNVPRNSPTTFNSALYNRAMFHDGRLFVLDAGLSANGAGQALKSPDSFQNLPDPDAIPNLMAAQARFPVTSLFEMKGYGPFMALSNATVRSAIEERLQAGTAWLESFRTAFGLPSATASELITYPNIATALGEYQRSQVFIATPWRDYVAGQTEAIPEKAKRGALLFFRSIEEGGAGCVSCHSGAHFSNEKFYVSGFPQIGRGKNTAQQDFGRREVTQAEADRFRFRVPSLLNVAKTAPYGHAGTFESLKDTVRYHINPMQGAAGFDASLQQLSQFNGLGVRYPNAAANTLQAAEAFMASDSRPLLYQKDISEEHLDYLVAFLDTLTDPCLDDSACLAPWIARPDRDNPDGSMLSACFRSDVVPGYPCGTEPGNDDNADPEPEPVALDPAPFVDPLRQAAMVNLLENCPDNLTGTGNTGQHAFISVPSTQSGLTHRHGFALSTWLNLAQRREDLIVSGAVAVGDINEDCINDLVFPAGDNGVHAYLGQGDGRYASTIAGLPARMLGAAIADLNGDYRPDFMLGEFSTATATTAKLQIAINQWPSYSIIPTDTSGVASLRNIGSISVGDFNLDGWPDLFIGMWTTLYNTVTDTHLWKGLGNMAFTPAEPAGLTNVLDFTFSPNFADINNDGRPDLVVASDFENSQVYLQEETGTFRKITNRSVISDENGMGAAVADFDNDGDLDWFVSSVYTTLAPAGNWGTTGNRFYRNPGNGLFTDDTTAAGVRNGGWGWGSCAADVDNDGDLDIYQVNGWGLPEDIWNIITLNSGATPPYAEFIATGARLFINDGSGRFQERAADWNADDQNSGRGLACLDADRDGDIDFLIANNSRSPSLLLNQSGAGNGRHFLSVRLVGKAPNTGSLGARIYVTANGKTQMREVGLGTNYLGNNPLEQHFGLASAARADHVRVHWPATGKELILDNVAANQFMVIAEP